MTLTPEPEDRVPEVILHEERLRVGAERTPYRRLRVAKRVVVEEQTVTVRVRREELVVEELDVADPGTRTLGGDTGDVGDSAPLVLVLSREVPDRVLLRTEPVEVVRVHVDTHTDHGPVGAQVRRERADVEVTG